MINLHGHTLDRVVKDLYASTIKGELNWGPDGGYAVRIGDPERGWVAKWESSDLIGAVDWMITRTVMEYPDSDFAEKYRPPEPEAASERRSKRG